MAQKKKQPKKKSKSKSTSKTRSRGGKPRAAKKSAKLKSRSRKAAAKPTRRTRKRKPAVNAEAEIKREFRGRNRTSVRTSPPQSSEDIESLSRAEGADSESVDELVDEGNAFEAGVVAGVEEADDSDEREVHTREVPEDDVPQEYLDED